MCQKDMTTKSRGGAVGRCIQSTMTAARAWARHPRPKGRNMTKRSHEILWPGLTKLCLIKVNGESGRGGGTNGQARYKNFRQPNARAGSCHWDRRRGTVEGKSVTSLLDPPRAAGAREDAR